jgi:hypothetical protein
MNRYRQHTNPPLDGKTFPGGTALNATEERPQAFAADIFVPLLQNVIGGGAVAGVLAILSVAGSRWASRPLSGEDIAFWCLLAGGAVACVVTVIRFFGDDIGLVRHAYRRGQESMRLRVNALELELEAAQRQVAHLMGQTKAMPSTSARQQLDRVYKAAEHLIHWHFEDLPIDRRSCESRNMSQSEWRRARHLLLAAGVLDENGITVRTLPEALGRAHAHHERLVRLGGHAESFVSPV